MNARLFDPRDLDDRFRANGFVATHAALRGHGMSQATISRRIGPRGPWQRLLPGVVLGHRGSPTRRELLLGALAFCGEHAVITGLDALIGAGLRNFALPPEVSVLIPIAEQRKSFGYARVERTRYLPKAVVRQDIPQAPVPRALIDTCRRTAELGDVRALVARTVQSRLCTIDQLGSELRTAARARTALAREVLAEVSDGVRSAAEGIAREVLSSSGLPTPIWNVRLVTPDGREILSPDAYWPEFAAALEIDSFAWHLSPDSYLRTMQRARWMTVRGVLTMPFGPVEILRAPDRFVREVAAFLDIARARPLPTDLVVLPAA